MVQSMTSIKDPFFSPDDLLIISREFKVVLSISIKDWFLSNVSSLSFGKLPQKVSFVGRKVGTSTGEFELKSKYTMLYLGEGVLDGTFAGSLPCGFEGYRFRDYNCSLNPFITYKTKYYTPGETIYDPPFGSGTGNNKVLSGGDKISKVYLGISNSAGVGYDTDFFDYKGKQAPTNICTGTVVWVNLQRHNT